MCAFISFIPHLFYRLLYGVEKRAYSPASLQIFLKVPGATSCFS
nr:MAG TPA: DNA-directed RNA polymerase II subunit [Caudoviricetes sp.]